MHMCVCMCMCVCMWFVLKPIYKIHTSVSDNDQLTFKGGVDCDNDSVKDDNDPDNGKNNSSIMGTLTTFRFPVSFFDQIKRQHKTMKTRQERNV